MYGSGLTRKFWVESLALNENVQTSSFMSIGTMIIEFKKKKKKNGKIDIIFPLDVFVLRYLVHNLVFACLVL